LTARDIEGDFSENGLAASMADTLRRMEISRPMTIMHVCGTHEHSIARAGIRSMLPDGLRLVAGPGCPVCVCPASDIGMAVQAARRDGTTLATFGDMYRVPAGSTSLEILKTEGRDVRIVYSPMDAVELAREEPHRQVVFMAVGFETTAGPIAAAAVSGVPDNFSMITSIRLVPPALRFLLGQGAGSIDGFILPGHVSTVLGRSGYGFLEGEEGVPSVISGFEPLDVLRGVIELAGMIETGPPFEVRNLYRRAVREEGNVKARKMIYEVFERADSSWRGIGVIPDSGLRLRERMKGLDGACRLGLEPDLEIRDVPPGCICHEVILGRAEPVECGLFGLSCTPRRPVGPCMVSSEGTCRARYQFRDPASERTGD